MAIGNMLVPVSLGKRDEKVLAYVCGLYAQGVRRVLAVTVVDSSGQEAPVLMRRVEQAREQLKAMADPLNSCDLSVEVRVVTGEVHSALLALAHQVDIDVICCGTEGKSLVDYLFSGSISEDLVTSGDVRTMTIRYDLLDATEDPAQLARDFARRLVVPTDFSASSLRAVLSAYERPAEVRGTIHLLHVLPPVERSEDREQVRADAEAQLRGLLSMAKDCDADAVGVIREGDPVEVVYDYVCEVDATGVITGRAGKGRLGREVLGSVSMKLLRDAPCPVVIQP